MFVVISFSTGKLRKKPDLDQYEICFLFPPLKLRKFCGKNSWNKLVKTSDEFVLTQIIAKLSLKTNRFNAKSTSSIEQIDLELVDYFQKLFSMRNLEINWVWFYWGFSQLYLFDPINFMDCLYLPTKSY